MTALPRQSIAIIGSGITGLSAAWALREVHDVTLFDQADRLGGHAHTVTIDYDGTPVSVDTGFIVYNTRNYPNLIGLFNALGTPTQPTDMSFACSAEGIEWCSTFPRGVFAQPLNLFRPDFIGMLADIARFNSLARQHLAEGGLDGKLDDYLSRYRFGSRFITLYLRPMAAAIWSCGSDDIGHMPVSTFLNFMANHNLLQFAQPAWRTVTGGSRTYVDAMAKALGQRVRLSSSIAAIHRQDGKPRLIGRDGHSRTFDQVILCTHAQDSLKLIGDPSPEQRRELGAIHHRVNATVLHRDPALMPKRKAAWGSWNAMGPRDGQPAYVSYWMNLLQGLEPTRPLFVSLNGPEPAPGTVFARFDYAHPHFDQAAVEAQARINDLQGRDGLWYAGAWLGHGFHEDGITAGLRVALALGGQIPWTFVDHRIPGGPMRVPPRQVQTA